MIAQGLATPMIYLVPVLLAFVGVVAVIVYFLIGWLGRTENKSKRMVFATIIAFWIFYQFTFPAYVSSESLTDCARSGVPSSKLLETVGPPHSISKPSSDEMVWYYETGLLANRTIGVTINRTDGRVVDWYVQ